MRVLNNVAQHFTEEHRGDDVNIISRSILTENQNENVIVGEKCERNCNIFQRVKKKKDLIWCCFLFFFTCPKPFYDSDK